MSLRLQIAAILAILVTVARAPTAGAAEPAKSPMEIVPNVAGGATSLRLLDLPFRGGLALLGVSAEAGEHFSFGADLEYVHASTPNGLLMQVGRLDLTPVLVLGRMRLGAGPHLTLLVINRETGGDAIRQLGFGAHAHASVDIVRFRDHGAVFLSIKPSIAKVGPAAVTAGDVTVGVRF